MPPTPPHVSAEILRTLHRIHRQLTDLRDRYDRGPKRVRAAESNVAHCESRLAEAQAELKKLRMAADQKQLQLKSSEDKVRELKRKLNAAASNREYQALKDQILADEMTNSVLADEILESLEKIDRYHETVREVEAGLAAARKKAGAIRDEVQEQHPTIEGDLARLEAELKEAEAALPSVIREPYQRVVRQRGEDALAAVEGEYCGGCHQHVPLNVCSAILMGQPTFCKTCGRLLYIPEGAVVARLGTEEE